MIYHIPELKAQIEAKDDEEFEIKKAKLLARNQNRDMKGGYMKNYVPKIKEF